MTELRRLKPDDGTEAILAALQADGGVIVQEMLTGELIDAINDELDPHIESADPTRIAPCVSFTKKTLRPVE